MAAHIAALRAKFGSVEVEHHIGDALAWAVIGVLPAAAAAIDRQALRIEQVFGPCAGAGGVERRVLQQPHQLGRGAGADRRDALLHRGDCFVIRHRPVAAAPLDCRRCRAHIPIHRA